MEMQKAPLFTSTKTLAHIPSTQPHKCVGQIVFRIGKQSLWNWGKRWKRSDQSMVDIFIAGLRRAPSLFLKDLVWYAPRTFYSDLKICQDSQFLLFHFQIYLLLIKYINCFCFWSICVKIERTSNYCNRIYGSRWYIRVKKVANWKFVIFNGVKADLSVFSL